MTNDKKEILGSHCASWIAWTDSVVSKKWSISRFSYIHNIHSTVSKLAASPFSSRSSSRNSLWDSSCKIWREISSMYYVAPCWNYKKVMTSEKTSFTDKIDGANMIGHTICILLESSYWFLTLEQSFFCGTASSILLDSSYWTWSLNHYLSIQLGGSVKINNALPRNRKDDVLQSDDDDDRKKISQL